MTGERVIQYPNGRLAWLPVEVSERVFDCDGYLDDAQCRHRPVARDPRDDALYCEMHKEAVDRHGVDGLNLRTRGQL